MENNNERVLAFNLATEVTEEQMQQTAGGAAMVTYQRTNFGTNKHGASDAEFDTDWD